MLGELYFQQGVKGIDITVFFELVVKVRISDESLPNIIVSSIHQQFNLTTFEKMYSKIKVLHVFEKIRLCPHNFVLSVYCHESGPLFTIFHGT